MDNFGFSHEKQVCDSNLGEFCCGSCSYRYCCSRKKAYLDQSRCLITEKTTSEPLTQTSTPPMVDTTISYNWDEFITFSWNDWIVPVTQSPSFWNDPNRHSLRWGLIMTGVFGFSFALLILIIVFKKRQYDTDVKRARSNLIARQQRRNYPIGPIANIPHINSSMYNGDLTPLPRYDSILGKMRIKL